MLRLLEAAARAEADPEADPGINLTRLLATSCVEGRLPWAPESPLEGRAQALERAVLAAPKGAFEPFGAATVARNSLTALCLGWPPTPRPEGVASRGPDVPVLVIAGRDDLRTPLEDARRTAAQYPRSRVLAVPGVGHSVLGSDPSGCALAGITAFLAGGRVRDCERPGYVLPRAPYIPAGLSGLKPQPGVPGVAGVVATAARVTLDELSRALSLTSLFRPSGQKVELAGLRGGSATASPRAIVLRSFEVIRGVRLTGTRNARSGRFELTAPGGVAGVLRTGSGNSVSGTIAGERVTFRLS